MRFAVVKPFAAVVFGALLVWSCVDSGPGGDFDEDGVPDQHEDLDADFVFEPGESDFLSVDTDLDGVCDGQASPGPFCVRCEDCNNDGSFQPCRSETDPLNDDTDNDGATDRDDGAPLDAFAVDCAGGDVRLAYGASLPPGKPFPDRPTPTLTPAPFPTSTPGPSPTLPPDLFFTPTP